MRHQYRLPDGNTTESADHYIDAWHELAKPIEEATNSQCFGFDPGLAFMALDDKSYTWSLQTREALLLRDALKK